MLNFSDFNFDEKILAVLNEIGYQRPTPIQQKAIPLVLEGKDIIASADTGTGKTAAFLLPALQMIGRPQEQKIHGPQILVLVPTRELAMQVASEAEKYSKYYKNFKTVCIFGGVPYPIQKRALSKRHEILVATPGRLIDHMNSGRIDLKGLKMLVLDEADRMLDMGFIGDVEKIASNAPAKRQTLLFSATLNKKVLSISKKLQKDPHEIALKSDLTLKGNIEQRLYFVDNVSHKLQLLDEILETTEIEQAIIFTSTKSQANKLSTDLSENGYLTAPLHGDMDQKKRTRTINKLRTGKIRILVATDVAGRGIDIPSLSHVINFDLTFQPEDFVHRIGRTGRAGASGVAITFATYKEEEMLSRINKLTGNTMKSYTIEGMEPKPKKADGPRPQKRRRRPRFDNKGKGFTPRKDEKRSAPGENKSSAPGNRTSFKSNPNKRKAGKRNRSQRAPRSFAFR